MTDPNVPPAQPPQSGGPEQNQPPAPQQPPQPPQQPAQGQQVPPQPQYQQPPQGQQPPQYQQPPQGQQAPPQYQQQPGQQYQQPQAAAPAAPLDADQDKLWASLAHFGGVLWLLPSLIIWLVFKDRGQRTAVEGKEALNWQITFVIVMVGWWIVTGILGLILALAGLGIIGLFFTLIGWLIYIANVVLSILGGVKVQQGGSYRYPVSFRFIK